MKRTVVEAVEMISKHAEGAERVYHHGSDKNIWAGIDPTHSYFQIAAKEKWDKSGCRFLKKLMEIVVPGEIFDLKRHRGRVIDRQKWEVCETITVVE